MHAKGVNSRAKEVKEIAEKLKNLFAFGFTADRACLLMRHSEAAASGPGS